MKKLFLFFALALTVSCKNSFDSYEYLESSINIIERNNAIFEGKRMYILRIPNSSNNITYVCRCKNELGFALLELRPQKRVIRSSMPHKIDLRLLDKLDSLITKKSFPILIEINNFNTLYRFKISDSIYTIIKGDSIFIEQNTRGYDSSILKNNRKIFKYKYRNSE